MKGQLRDIEYFAVLAEHLNIGRAAEALGLSQPALSKSLRRLEQSMQSRLVRRTHKGVELTTVGAALLGHVSRLRLSLEDVTREMADLSQGQTGHLRISSGTGLVAHVVTIACARLMKEAPRAAVRISDMGIDVTVAGLRRGEFDLGVNTFRDETYEDLLVEPLFEEEFVICVSAGHRLAAKKRVTLADLARERWVVSAAQASAPRHLRETFLKAGLPPPSIAMEITSMALRQRFLAESDAVGLASRHMLHLAAPLHRFVELRVKEFTYRRNIGIYYRKNAYLAPVARRFIECLRKTAAEIAGKR